MMWLRVEMQISTLFMGSSAAVASLSLSFSLLYYTLSIVALKSVEIKGEKKREEEKSLREWKFFAKDVCAQMKKRQQCSRVKTIEI